MTFASAAAAVAFTHQGEVQDPKKGKTLIFSEEFNGEGVPSPEKWLYEVGKVRNNEAQYYTKERSKNARLEKGRLILEAHKEAYEGAEVTSASITTLKSFTHAYVEVKAKFPTGRGTWPAIWLLGEAIRKPQGQGFVNWPMCGEIDMMENVGFDPEVIHFNIHCEAHNHMNGNGRGASVRIPKAWEKDHVYGLDWTPTKLDFYLNGQKVFTYAKSEDPKAWPFDSPHYIILNLAIGGGWGGAQGIDDAIFPSRFEVDYVRVYKQAQAG